MYFVLCEIIIRHKMDCLLLSPSKENLKFAGPHFLILPFKNEELGAKGLQVSLNASDEFIFLLAAIRVG